MKDRFSAIASGYAAFRPAYPKELYKFIFQYVSSFDQAWDAGTGSGQAASDLAMQFRDVYATDISARQLEGAARKENIRYAIAGETTDLPDHSVDLITVAQAIHWFDREKFYKEVRRVAGKNGILAVWGYSLLRMDGVIDSKIQNFYHNVVGTYWDAERKLIDMHYRTIDFPFDEITAPAFQIQVSWSLEEFKGYLNTWSAVQNFRKINNEDPVDEFVALIGRDWKQPKMDIVFPVFLRIGRLND